MLGWAGSVRPFSFADKERENMDMDLLAAKVSELAGFVWNGLLLYLLPASSSPSAPGSSRCANSAPASGGCSAA